FRRDVRLRGLGSISPQADARARSHGREAALLLRGRASVRVRIRAAGLAGASGRAAGPESRRARPLSGLRVRPRPHSILAGVAKLPPGHVATVSHPDLQVEVTQYWDLTFRPDYSLSEAEWADRLRWQLEASVRRRLVSDVPLGFFLS